MTTSAELAGSTQAMTGGKNGVETQAGDQHSQERQTQPPLTQVAVTVVTGADVLVCKVFIFIVTMVEKTLSTGKTGHTLYPLPEYIRTVSTGACTIVCL